MKDKAGRSMFWGWLLGGLVGMFVGFYGLLLLLAKLRPGLPYEEGLDYLFIGAGCGLVAGGHALSTLLKSRGNR